LHHVVGGHAESDQAFAAAVSSERRVLEELAEIPRLLERVFPQIPHTHVELHRRHEVDHVVTGFVHGAGDGSHHARRHARGPQALLPVTQGGVDDAYAPAHCGLTRNRTAPSSIIWPSCATISAISPFTPALTVLNSFITSMMQTVSSSLTTEPTSTN